uniref:Nuclear receptor domain-containing protein n=1 Tax=Meloidogyne incognita TaxID=6306 RepID=A0A914LZ87_MELIC
MQRNFVKQCKVCGAKENVYYHFGVCTCRACGAFFRFGQTIFHSKPMGRYTVARKSKNHRRGGG